MIFAILFPVGLLLNFRVADYFMKVNILVARRSMAFRAELEAKGDKNAFQRHLIYGRLIHVTATRSLSDWLFDLTSWSAESTLKPEIEKEIREYVLGMA